MNKVIFIYCLVSCQILIGQKTPFPLSQMIRKEEDAEANKMSELHQRYNPTYMQQTPEMINRKWKEIDLMKSFIEKRNQHSEWELIGPTGAVSSDDKKFIVSGRVRDLEVISKSKVRIGAASGGLWELNISNNGTVNKKMISSSDVNSIWIGAFATDPNDEKTIILGTGEPMTSVGSGAWRTTDGGLNWVRIEDLIHNKSFHKIEYTAQRGQIWCAGQAGVYFSEDHGLSWSNKKLGNISGLAIHHQHPDTLLIAQYGLGIFRSFDRGKSWKILNTSNGLPVSGLGRINLANSVSQPNIIYALIVKKDHFTEGIYKTIDFGNNWIKCPGYDANGVLVNDFHWGQGWYNSMIEVSPVNPNHVIVGGGWWMYSTDGFNFYGPPDAMHPDMHAAGWTPDGSDFYLGNDGGVYRAPFIEQVIHWDFRFNNLPITQIHNLSVSKKNPEIILTGGQDNGVIFFDHHSKDWYFLFGDGGGVAADPNYEDFQYCTLGAFGGALAFRNLCRYYPEVDIWKDSNTGIDESRQWWRQVRTDYNEPTTVYTQSGNAIYESHNYAQSWNKILSPAFSFQEIWWMMLSQGPKPVVYISSGEVGDGGVWSYETERNNWTDISDGLPVEAYSSIAVLYPSQNTNTPHVVYAIVRGEAKINEGKKVFVSKDYGQYWENITGNLPNLPYTVVLENPTNPMDLIVGTDGYGIFRSLDAGKSWSSWVDGFPRTALIRDIDFQLFNNDPDSLYVVVATYGNSVWRRHWDRDQLSSTKLNHLESDHPYKVHYNNNKLHVQIPQIFGDQMAIRLTDLKGIVISNQIITKPNNQIEIPVGPLIQGMYLLTVYDSYFKPHTQLVLVENSK